MKDFCDEEQISSHMEDDGGHPVSINQDFLLTYQEVALCAGRPLPPLNRVDAFMIDGVVDIRALTEAFAALIARHSVLRSLFEPTRGISPNVRRKVLDTFRSTGVSTPGLYRQRQVAHHELNVRTLDWAHSNSSEFSRAVRELIWEEHRTPFDILKPPLIRATVARLGAKCVLFVAVPMLICDESSVDVMVRDLFLLYDQIALGGRECVLHPPTQFCDFAMQQAERCLTTYYEPSIDFWSARWGALQSCQIDPLELRYGNGDDNEAHGGGAICDEQGLSEKASAGVRAYANRHGVAPFVLFMAAYGVFLSRETGRERTAVWMICENRGDDESEGMVGWLANRHAVEINTSSPSCVEEHIEACRLSVVRAQRHQELPLPLLWSRLKRVVERPGPPVKLAWNHGSTFGGVNLRVARMNTPAVRPPHAAGLTTTVTEDGAGFKVTMVHPEERFRPSSTRSALARFCSLVGTMTSPAQGTNCVDSKLA